MWFRTFCICIAIMASPAFGIKVLKYSEDGSPTTLDPVQSATTYSNLVVTAVYDTLYEYRYLKSPYELKPNLAASMPSVSKDGLVYTISLKKGVRFMNDPAFEGGKGREVVAEDFIYSIKRHFDIKNRSQGAWLWRGRVVGLDDWKKAGSDYSKKIEGLMALDKYTIQVTLTKPFPQIVYTFAMGFSGIVPKEAVAKYGSEISVRPVGSGPFMVESFSPQKVVMVRNPNFRKEIFDINAEGYDEKIHGFTGIGSLNGKTLPIVDRVEVSFIKQSVARWNSFTKGNEIQFATIPSEMVDQALASKSPMTLKSELAKFIHLRPEKSAEVVYSGFNLSDSDFGYHPDPKRNERNRKLRCAVRSAFNWQQRIQRFYFGVGEAFPGVIPPFLDSYSSLGSESIAFDPKKAKKLLKEGGWNKSNLPVLEYSGVSSVNTKNFYEQFRGFMRRAGYPRHKIKFKQFATFGDYNKALKQKSLKFIALAWGLDYPDSENLMQLFYGPNGSPGSNNINFSNTDFDSMYEQASVMKASPARTALYKKMSEILIDECAVISGFSRTKLLVWHKDAVMYPSRVIIGNVFKYIDVK